MNIWCISKYASLPRYGTASRLFFLTKEFNQLGHNAVLITSDANHLASFPDTNERYNSETIDSTNVVWIKTKKYVKTASASRMLSWFDFERWLFRLDKKKLPKPDIVIVSSLSLLSIVYGYYLKKKYKSFLVFEIRDIWPLTMTEEGGFNRWHPLVLFLGIIEKIGYKKSDLIVGTMPKLDLHVEAILGYKRPFFCSPLGFNEQDYSEVAERKQHILSRKFPKDKVIIGYAGSMGITNALEPFIACIKQLENNGQIHFMLVGSGDLKGSFEDQLAGNTNVTFLPRLEQGEVKYFLSNCDVLYLSTQDSNVWKFGQSMNKVVEYMLSAKPVIASYTGFPSMINEADSGVFISDHDPRSIASAILDYVELTPLQRAAIGDKGRKWIYENRLYSKLAKDYLDEIEKYYKLKCHGS